MFGKESGRRVEMPKTGTEEALDTKYYADVERRQVPDMASQERIYLPAELWIVVKEDTSIGRVRQKRGFPETSNIIAKRPECCCGCREGATLPWM
jgi:hypothetical protein